MILIFSKFLMDFYKNNQNAAILKIIKILKNCHGRFTANYLKFLWSHSIHGKIWYNFTPTFFKIWKIWALCCIGASLLRTKNNSSVYSLLKYRVISFIKSRVLGHECFDWLFVYLVLIPVSCFVVLFSVLFRFQLSVHRPNHSPSCSNTAPLYFCVLVTLGTNFLSFKFWGSGTQGISVS